MNESELHDIATEVLTTLRTDCPAIPDAHFTIYYDQNMSQTTLAYTTTWFYNSNPIIQDVYYVGHDFEIAVHPDVPWWTGNCSNLPLNMYDLRTTLLHEFIHGVGILSSIHADKSAMPVIYDLQLRDAYGEPVVHGDEFQGEFGQPLYVNNVRVYNPPEYQPGSSFAHYEQSGVMDYAQNNRECTRHIDHGVVRLLNSIGYNCTSGYRSIHMEGQDYMLVIIGVAVVVIGFITCACSSISSKKPREKRPLLA